MQDAPRLFVNAALTQGATVEARAGQAHYLTAVMRRAVGDTVRLFNGRDGEFLARIATARRDRATFTTETRLRPQADEPGPWLVFAPLKRDATDLVVQKATELGATSLLPVLTARTIATRINAERLTAIAIEAAEQSERLTIPTLHAPTPLATLLATWPMPRRLIAAIERTAAPFPDAIADDALLIGPEGGFTDQELDWLRARPFVHAASLGPRILRAETAAIAGLALLTAAQSPVPPTRPADPATE